MKNRHPRFILPPGFDRADDYLAHLCAEALREKRDPARGHPKSLRSQKALDRADAELKDLQEKGLVDTVLIIYDLVTWARQRKSLEVTLRTPLHSFILFLLGVTTVNPADPASPVKPGKHGKFRPLDRYTLEFSSNGRDLARTYLAHKYGRACVGYCMAPQGFITKDSPACRRYGLHACAAVLGSLPPEILLYTREGAPVYMGWPEHARQNGLLVIDLMSAPGASSP
jgi:hypothetical protein